MKIAITGANSSVGLNLLEHLKDQAAHHAIAGVRSRSVFESLPASPLIEPRQISYTDGNTLAEALGPLDCLVHLAGILIETRHTRYQQANVEATAATVAAAGQLGARHFVFTSVLGADPDSPNVYFRSKGLAEEIVRDSGLRASIIRTPILLGPGTAGADALLALASKPKARVLGGGAYTLRPLDTDDLSRAILACAESEGEGVQTYELAGPEALSYRDLIERTASIMGNSASVGSVPIWLARTLAGVGSRLSGGGISPTVIDVITRDETLAANADQELGLSLTPLDQTLAKILAARNTA